MADDVVARTTKTAEQAAEDVGKVGPRGARSAESQAGKVADDTPKGKNAAVPEIDIKVRTKRLPDGKIEVSVDDMIQHPGQRPFTRGSIEGKFDPATGDLEIDWVGVDIDFQGQGIGSNLYKQAIDAVGGEKVKSVTGEMAFSNWTAIQEGGIQNAPRVKILNKLGFTEHSFNQQSRIMVSRRPN